MALSGTLRDIGIVDLIQLPHGGRRSGALRLSSARGQAELFYSQGRLVHATLGSLAGLEALVDVVAWTEADFEFLHGVDAPRVTIELDLHRAVMVALKTGDERKAEEERRATVRLQEGRDEERLERALAAFAAAHPFAVHARIVDPAGASLAAVGEVSEAEHAASALSAALQALRRAHARAPLRRVLLDDSRGTVAFVPLDDERALVVLADPSASAGAVSMSVGRLAATLLNGGDR